MSPKAVVEKRHLQNKVKGQDTLDVEWTEDTSYTDCCPSCWAQGFIMDRRESGVNHGHQVSHQTVTYTFRSQLIHPCFIETNWTGKNLK